MKKILLSLGATSAMIAPIATVVACGDDLRGQEGVPEYHFISKRLYTNAMEIDDLDKYFNVDEFTINWDNIIEDGYSSVEFKIDELKEKFPDNIKINEDMIKLETYLNPIAKMTEEFPGYPYLKYLYNDAYNRYSGFNFEKMITIDDSRATRLTECHLKGGVEFADDVEYVGWEFLRSTISKEHSNLTIPNSVRFLGIFKKRNDESIYARDSLFYETRYDDADPENNIEGSYLDVSLDLSETKIEIIGENAFEGVNFPLGSILTLPKTFDIHSSEAFLGRAYSSGYDSAYGINVPGYIKYYSEDGDWNRETQFSVGRVLTPDLTEKERDDLIGEDLEMDQVRRVTTFHNYYKD